MKKAADNKWKRGVSRAVFVVLCFIALSAVTGNAENKKEGDPNYIFYKANTLYEEGNYSEAINEYLKLLSQGMESGSLYYNLGNSYVKNGEFGKAVLNYERAKRLIPRDGDLKSNYKFALSQIKSSVPETYGSWPKRALAIFNAMTVNEITLILSAVFLAAVFFLIFCLYVPVSGRFFRMIVSGFLIVFVIVAFSLFNRMSVLDREAVIVSGSPEALFEPFENATRHFTLYEGMKVDVLQSKKEWLKIRRSDGKVGWIMDRNAEKI
jgi:tetratricopeptide (TPR) repeat protein